MVPQVHDGFVTFMYKQHVDNHSRNIEPFQCTEVTNHPTLAAWQVPTANLGDIEAIGTDSNQQQHFPRKQHNDSPGVHGEPTNNGGGFVAVTRVGSWSAGRDVFEFKPRFHRLTPLA